MAYDAFGVAAEGLKQISAEQPPAYQKQAVRKILATIPESSESGECEAVRRLLTNLVKELDQPENNKNSENAGKAITASMKVLARSSAQHHPKGLVDSLMEKAAKSLADAFSCTQDRKENKNRNH